MNDTREEMPLDVLYVGGGPANLAGAVHLAKQALEKGIDIEIGLIEKGDIIGAHMLSGAILDPRSLKALIPDYLEKGCPVEETDCRDKIYFLTKNRAYALPYAPGYMHNDGCLIISLSKFARWLGEQAEELGVNIFPGFAGTEVLYADDDTRILGVGTGDKGRDKDGQPKSNFEPGVNLTAKVTVFGEGPKGGLMRDIGEKMGIFEGKMPQVFESAIKEVIEIPESSPFWGGPTTVIHTFGHPFGRQTKGGGFLYRMQDNTVSLGLAFGLDYEDAALEPYHAFLEFKRHPLIAGIIKDGKVLQQGAKTLSAGGLYTMPQLAVNGALFVGDGASMLNTQRLKGIHTAMQSGMLAAETIVTAFEKDDFSVDVLGDYAARVEKSWIQKELYRARNFSQALSKPGISRFVHVAVQHMTGGRGFRDPMAIEEDSATLQPLPAAGREKVAEAAPDGLDDQLYVDKLTGVYLSGTQHEEDQPCHLVVHDRHICATECYERYLCPCTRFCPGQVYEMEGEDADSRRLILNPSNCLHCKTCEIKDPFKNITWTCPEGGGGPNYTIT